MAAAFTPGPWHADDQHVYAGDDHSRDGKKKNAITMGGCGCCNGWAEGVHKPEDARLIAAAPDMRAALTYYRDECTGAEPSLSVFHQMLEAALAKAVQP